ncbi:MAG: flagellin [Betaproteobacteria bacterium]|nr:flagellin [Betaproteobacteria bacterium]
MSVINTNVKALTAQGSLSSVNDKISKSMQRLSTGLRINSAKDDAAGLAITNKMTSDIRGLSVAIRNANDGLSLAQTAEGAISQINAMLQRMRELAVQASNGTSSELARKGSQEEVDQLKLEINNIAARTSFNGIKLLDGSASNLSLQTGSEFGQTMDLNLASVSTSNMGIGSRPSLSSTNTTDTAANLLDATYAGNAVLRSGDLIINGVTVGGSAAIDDGLSKDAKAASSIAKAAAINKVSGQSGVKAVVNETYAAGYKMTALASGAATRNGYIVVNGVTTSTLIQNAYGSDLGVIRKNVVDAINSVSSQTGVLAYDSGDANNGVVLKAADGRNITVSITGGTSTLTNTDIGIDTKTTTGSYSLQSINGEPIVLSSTASGDISKAGLTAGTYASNVSATTTRARTVSTTGYAADAGELTSGTLKINGVAIAGSDPSDDKASDITATNTSSRSASAIAIAAAINKSTSLTGVTAKVSANIVSGGTTSFSNAANLTDNLYLNGVTVAFNLTAGYTRKDVVDTINAYTGQTGVVARDNGVNLTLTAEDGRNISLAAGTNAAKYGLSTSIVSDGLGAGALAAAAYTTYSKITLTSDKQFSLTAGSEGNAQNFEKLGFKEGTFGGESNGFKVADVDISSQDGAMASLKAIDAALESVSSQQSKIGALQNRLDSAISNLTEVSRNTSESRSRIMDADYAVETTNLAKSQIVQQAATAMLAQANQSAQSVLALLK